MKIHQKIIQAQAIMIHKNVNNVVPNIVSELFSVSNVNYNLRSVSQFHEPSPNTVWKEQEAISYSAPKSCNMMSDEMNQKSSLFDFKRESNGSSKTVHVRYVKNYLPNIAFI